MGKKSAKHIRVRTFRGRPTSLLGNSSRFDLNIPLWRTGMSDFMISTMSRYVICVGGRVGSSPGYGFSGSQLSMRT